MPDKKLKLINILGIVFFVLLILSFFVKKHKEAMYLNKKGITKIEIDKNLKDVYESFNLKEEWIIKSKSKKPISDSLRVITNVKLPYDLTTLEFINKLYQKFKYNDVTIKVDEIEINGSCGIKFIAGNVVKEFLKVKQYEKLKRNFTTVGFYVTDLQYQSEDVIEELLSFPFEYGCLVAPDGLDKQLLDSLSKNYIEYSILLNDKISNTKYRFNAEYSQRQLRKKLNLLFSDFKEAKSYIIDDKAKIYGSILYSFLKEEFKRSGKPIHLLSNYISVSGKDKDNTISLIKFNLVNNIGKQIIILIESIQLLEIKDFLYSSKEKGNKFLLPSLIN